VIRLGTGADLRVSGPAAADAVLCVNGGQRAAVEGTWSASLEWLVARLAPRFPQLRFAELRYRVKSWEHLDLCIADARAALAELRAERTLLVGFSMGGAVSSVVADDPSVEAVVGIAPWLPKELPLAALAGKRFRVVHGSLDRALPGIPGVSPDSSRAGFERALDAGASGDYTLLSGAVHGLALRAPWGRPVPLPRARAWVRAVASEVARFASPG
jgi:pimeloyl-ACP methyl ester carboxylesterase